MKEKKGNSVSVRFTIEELNQINKIVLLCGTDRSKVIRLLLDIGFMVVKHMLKQGYRDCEEIKKKVRENLQARQLKIPFDK